jgi:cobalamin transport system substrate-binding protein
LIRVRRLRLLRWVAAVLILLPGEAFAAARSLQSPNARAVETHPARTVTDGFGRRVKIPAVVNRIVSLAPNLTETLYALGLQDKLVGDTTYCDIPPAAKLKPHVGGPQNASIEAIVALRPDLVLATAINREETVDGLAHLGIPVYTTDPHTVRGMIESFGRIADMAGAEKEGAALTANLDGRLDALHAKLAGLPPVRVVFVVWLDPFISVGQSTFIADALRRAGAESVVRSNQNWPQLSFEEVVRLQPDYLVFAHSHTGEEAVTVKDLRSRAVWKDLRAVRQNHIAIVSDEVDRPAPGLIDAIEQLAREIHPGAFQARVAPALLHGENFRATGALGNCGASWRPKSNMRCRACAR